MEYNIAISTNERYMPGAIVAAVSVAVNAKPESHLNFHIFTEGVKQSTFALLESAIKQNHPDCNVIRHEINESQLSGLPYWAGSRMAAARCLYADLLPTVDWCLYLDCDILYLASIEEHFDFCDETKLALVSMEQSGAHRQSEISWIRELSGVDISEVDYFNSGVVLFNFRLMRQEGVSQKLVDFFRQHREIPSPDQDALNSIMVGRTKILPPKWNRLQVFLDDAELSEKPVIHYVSGIPWLPRLGAVANGRFELWHAFADKYVWGKSGESCKRLFDFKTLALKRLFSLLLKTPLVGIIFAKLLEMLNMVSGAKGWRQGQVGCDISRKGIATALARREDR